jgi:hypothetical protein
MKLHRLAFVLFMGCPLFAGAVYTQALVNGMDGGPFSNDPSQLFADAFSIAQGAHIDQAVWFGAAFNNAPFTDFNVEFFSSANGSPGSRLAKFTGTPTMVDQGSRIPTAKRCFGSP